MQVKSSPPSHIAILGAGSIGVAYAAAFLDAAIDVTLIDPDSASRDKAPMGVQAQHVAIATAGLSQGGQGSLRTLERADNGFNGVDLILECGPERLNVKQAIFAELLDMTSDEAVLATASSAMTIGQIVPDPARQQRCIVAHPVNPPSVLRVVELVPGPGTNDQTTQRAAHCFRLAGFEPVVLGKEIEGFVLNRLQGAVLREAYRLVADGVSDVSGIDAVVRLGLGPRWALSGPFETAELNTPGGIRAHAKRMGPAYKRMGEARGETVAWTEDLIANVAAQRRQILPEDALPSRAVWRSQAVAALIARRNELMQMSQPVGANDDKDN